jgi:hypothetical protein
MDAELYSRIFCALAIALAGSLVFMAVGHVWMAVGDTLQRRNPFGELISLEPGHRVRQSLQKLDRRYYLCLAGLLVYVLLFGVALVLPSQSPDFDVSEWVWLASAVVLAVVSLLLPFRIVKLKQARVRLGFRRTASIAVGHALQRIASRGYNIYHDVRVGNQIIDNVVIGTKGAYAVNVFVLGNNRAKSGTARLDDSSLVIGKAKTSAPVGVSVNRVGGLSKELSKVIGHPIRVRSVIAVPGWNVASTDSDKHLLVNEKNVVMLTGWTDPDTYLMDDDVAQIHDYLATRCMNGKQTPN